MTARFPVPCDLHDTGKPIADLDVGEAHFERASQMGMALTMHDLRGWKRVTKRRLLVRAGQSGYWVWRAL